MRRQTQPLFALQPQSKAVLIVHPESGEPRPTPVSQKDQPARIVPPAPHPTTKDAQLPLNTPPAFANRQEFPPLPGTERKSPEESSGHGHNFDIYARPFVPEAFSILNQLNGYEVNTPGIKQIDFGAYVGRCIGWDFLPVIPRPIGPPPMNAFCSLVDNIINTGYESYFRYHLEAEIQSQKLENESYSLFGHDITTLTHDTSETTCSFLVPGLRENSPYVEEDDIIQLRELIYDHAGRLLGMELWMTQPILFNRSQLQPQGFPAPGGRWRGEPAPGWTGIIYNARVLAVRRKESRLVVKIDGSPDMRYSFSRPDGLKFNVQFPVPGNRYLPMKHVLPIIQKALRHADITRYQLTNGVPNQSQASSSNPSSDSGGPLNLGGPPNTPWLQSMLFPIEADCDVQTMLNRGSFKRAFFDQQLNWEQMKAIGSICSHNYATLPFLVSGPPGTGKTKTLVEVALQLVQSVDGVSHVLFCAPSDPAADMIVQRISSHFNSTELLRLNRPSRTFAEVPGAVLPFCCIAQDKFDLPKFEQLMSCKLVVTTCRDASLLLHSRVTNVDLFAAEYGLRTVINPYAAPPSQVELHWTALIIDEAAQAMEPEALIPLAIVAPPLGPVKLAFKPLFIMAGDEHQLGPRTSLPSSPLKTSLFARLFARPVYADHPLARGKSGERAPRVLNKSMLPIARPAFANLIRNYRSHSAILAVPSSLFYFDTLEPEADDTDRLTSWSEWRGRKWPVLLHISDSEDDMDLNNGGWYNVGEAQLACAYAARLVQSGLVAQKEVCIMSPFKAQVACLRRTIREARFGSLWDVDIGPTEAFQGLERGVVIICTTRSKPRFVESDQKANWGLIGMPNAMNVALTRAKFGLIVIGRREILLLDPNWRAFLDFCDRNGLVAGEADRLVQDRENIELTRLEKVLLAQEQDSTLSNSRALKVVSQEDEMWTGGMQAALDAESANGYEESDLEGNDQEEHDDKEQDGGEGKQVPLSQRFLQSNLF
jgi:DNA polymerase III delta prime subunit